MSIICQSGKCLLAVTPLKLLAKKLLKKSTQNNSLSKSGFLFQIQASLETINKNLHSSAYTKIMKALSMITPLINIMILKLQEIKFQKKPRDSKKLMSNIYSV